MFSKLIIVSCKLVERRISVNGLFMRHGPWIDGTKSEGLTEGAGAPPRPGCFESAGREHAGITAVRRRVASRCCSTPTPFIFLFLPIVVTMCFVLAARVGPSAAQDWLALSSLFFYGAWNVRFLPLLLASILFNYAMAKWLIRARSARTELLLAAGRRRPRPARLLQIRQFLRRDGQRRHGRALVARRGRAAARHLLLHVPADHPSGGRQPRPASNGFASATSCCS